MGLTSFVSICEEVQKSGGLPIKWNVRRAGRNFAAGSTVETAGILCVFQGFHRDALRQKNRCYANRTFLR